MEKCYSIFTTPSVNENGEIKHSLNCKVFNKKETTENGVTTYSVEWENQESTKSFLEISEEKMQQILDIIYGNN